MRVVKIILVILMIAIVVTSITNQVVAWVVLSLLGPFIQLFLGPIIVTVKLFHIVYFSLFAALIIAISSILVLKMTISNRWVLVVIVFIIFWLVHVPYSIYLGERHIHLTAKAKYSLEAQDVNINLGGWYKILQGNHMGLPGHDRYLGKPHGYIYQDGEKCNWSFMKNDFTCPRR